MIISLWNSRLQLELNDNKLHGQELKQLTKYTNLYTLKFANNLIKGYEDLEPLVLFLSLIILFLQKSLKNLSNLDLTGNPIAQKPDYKDKLFEMFPKLEVLDQYDKEGNEVISEGDDDEYGSDAYGDEDGLGEDDLGEDPEEEGDDQFDGEYDEEDEEEPEYDDEDEEEDEAPPSNGKNTGKRKRQDD